MSIEFGRGCIFSCANGNNLHIKDGGIHLKTSKNIQTEHEKELVKLLMAECQSTGEIQEKLKRLFAGTIEQMFEAKTDEHPGYDKNSVLGNNSRSSQNGYNRKTIISDYGSSEVAVPRDGNGEFETKVLEKRQVRTNEIEQKIIAMYSKGMSQRDIEDTLREIYGTDVSPELVSKITDSREVIRYNAGVSFVGGSYNFIL